GRMLDHVLDLRFVRTGVLRDEFLPRAAVFRARLAHREAEHVGAVPRARLARRDAPDLRPVRRPRRRLRVLRRRRRGRRLPPLRPPRRLDHALLVGWVHLVGEAPAGLSGQRRRGLRDLAIAVAAGALIWLGDMATGGHLAGAVNAFAARLSVWFEERREPVVTCEPGKPRPYTALAGAVLQVPQGWQVEVAPLLDLEVHRFHDPEARAGTLSVSVEPIASEDDGREFAAEFDRMAALSGARVDGAKAGEARPGGAGYRPSVPDSLAERILHSSDKDDAGTPSQGGAVPRPASASVTAAGSSAPRAGFHRVEAGGLIGPPPKSGKSALLPDGTYSKRTWTWLLIGDREAVRIVYSVRADWSGSQVVGREFERARALAESAAPASAPAL